MSCDYHKGIVYPLTITITTTKKYKVPLMRTPKSRMNVSVTWFGKVEGDDALGKHYIMYDFQEKDKPETRTIKPVGFKLEENHKDETMTLSYFKFGNLDAKNPKGCIKSCEIA